LYTAPVSNTVMLTWSASWIWRHKRGFLRDLLAVAPEKRLFNWKLEVWPFQWKIGLSWLSGYFIFRLFVPSLIAMNLPVAAGQMGLSLTMMGAIGGIALAWMTTKSAPFGTLIANRDFSRLDRVFFSCLWQSVTVAAIGGAALLMVVIFLNHIHQPLAHRVLPPQALALLIGTMLVSQVIASEAIYLRAHKQEPFLWLSLGIGVLVAASTYFLGRHYAALGMTAGYFTVMLIVGLGGGTWIFIQKRRQWHQESPLILNETLQDTKT
ncbi:MAG: hypothetical protein M3Y13_09675, partial [Armatimonadota bacterium]|nr:hypothetical protein [Armatimonadota bacterium]